MGVLLGPVLPRVVHITWLINSCIHVTGDILDSRHFKWLLAWSQSWSFSSNWHKLVCATYVTSYIKMFCWAGLKLWKNTCRAPEALGLVFRNIRRKGFLLPWCCRNRIWNIACWEEFWKRALKTPSLASYGAGSGAVLPQHNWNTRVDGLLLPGWPSVFNPLHVAKVSHCVTCKENAA